MLTFIPIKNVHNTLSNQQSISIVFIKNSIITLFLEEAA